MLKNNSTTENDTNKWFRTSPRKDLTEISHSNKKKLFSHFVSTKIQIIRKLPLKDKTKLPYRRNLSPKDHSILPQYFWCEVTKSQHQTPILTTYCTPFPIACENKSSWMRKNFWWWIVCVIGYERTESLVVHDFFKFRNYLASLS